jgi:group II intron reverse transcriptase/maturase
VDGATKVSYGENLAENLEDLHTRMKQGRYRHQPIRRVNIPKGNGKTRPIGISTVEDKVVQGALREVLEAVYEQDFMDCSHGFRPGRSAHDAIRMVNRSVFEARGGWILEADIKSFFDSIDRKKLQEMIQDRVPDGSIKRLVGKCLSVGVLDGEVYTEPEEGTAQGSGLSPLLGNIYLHYVLDVWFEDEVVRRLRGKASLIRYADDFIVVFERQDDAERVMGVLGQRMRRYGLELHPEKTRLISFGWPPRRQEKGKGPGTFDFLGFTVLWTRSRNGKWRMGFKTRRASLRKAIRANAEWCRRHRHHPVRDQHAMLCKKIRGHFNYFAINGNCESLQRLTYQVGRRWFKWLRRRSQRKHHNWDWFNEVILTNYPLPSPRVCVQIWERV